MKRDGFVVATYAYDANGNRTSWSDFWGAGTATHDSQDRLLAAGATSYAYTASGELASQTAGSETTSYVYDVQGALTQVTLPTGIAIEYVTDADGRRIGKRVNGVLVQGWIYAGGLAPIAETNGAGTITTRYVYGTRVNVPELLVRGGRTYRILTDHLGSVRFVVDAADGTIVQRLDYDAFGRITLDTNPGWQPFGFAGGMYDSQTGLVRFGARDYDPEIGRWTSKDPIGFAGWDANLYGYVLGDPINALDPTGLYFECSQSCQEELRFNADFRDALSESLGEVPVIGAGLAWIVDGALASFLPTSRTDLVSIVEGGLQSLANPVGSTVTLRTTVHHIATNKNSISRAAGGPYTPRFSAIFEKARMTLESSLNRIPILGHRGPHPEYNRVVYQRLRSTVDGLEGAAYREALERELLAIGHESATAGTVLNRLLTGE